MKLALKKLLQANPSIQVSTLLSGSLSTPSAKQAYVPINGYYSIASATPSSTNEVVFSNIPSIYTHLEIRITSMSTVSAINSTDIFAFFNTYGTGTYSGTYLGRNTSNNVEADNYAYADVFWAGIAYNNGNPNNRYSYGLNLIPNYSSSSMKKTIFTKTSLGSDNAADYDKIYMVGSSWNQTTAISSLTLRTASGLFKSGTRIDLYGIGGE